MSKSCFNRVLVVWDMVWRLGHILVVFRSCSGNVLVMFSSCLHYVLMSRSRFGGVRSCFCDVSGMCW